MSDTIISFRPRPRAEDAESFGALAAAVRCARRHCECRNTAWTISARQVVRAALDAYRWPLATRVRLEQVLEPLDRLDAVGALAELRSLERELYAARPEVAA